MARYDPFRGKKVSELLEVKPDEFRSWDIRKLRAFVTRIASATNKRVRRLDAAEVASNARQRLASEGGPITARGKETTDELIQEYQRARNFLTSPTGNVQGARRAEKARYDPFRGKKIADLLKVKPDEFRSWDIRKQRAFVTRIASATNKRVRRLDAAEVASSARQRLASEGGPITARGKETTDELLQEYQRARNFLMSPTGNVQGARRAEKARNEALEKFGIDPNTWTYEQASNFEVIMNRYRDYARDRGISYQQLAQAVDNIMHQNAGLTEDDLSREVNKYINNEYQRQQRRWNTAKPGAKLTTTPGGRPLNGTPFRLVLGGKR